MEPRFIADSMLGKLATWLRIVGCDVEYFGRIPDGDLADRVEETGRILLTRDTLIVKRRKVRDRHFFVRGDSWRDQLRQVVERFAIDPYARPFTRCVRCNEPLAPLERSRAEGRVPPYVFETQPAFTACPSCGRIYWRATHRAGMEDHLKGLLGL